MEKAKRKQWATLKGFDVFMDNLPYPPPHPLLWPPGQHRNWYKSALHNNWSKLTYFSSQSFQVIIYQQDKSIFPLKRARLSFRFMRPLNLSTTCFNTTHNMWNGCTLEQCTLPALPRYKALLCKWIPGLAIHLGWKSVPNHEIITLIFT